MEKHDITYMATYEVQDFSRSRQVKRGNVDRLGIIDLAI